MRLFFAVEIPEDVQAALASLRPAGTDREYRWSNARLLHVTLAFLGQQPDARVSELLALGRAAADASAPGILQLGEPGSFGPRSAPRVLWIGLAGDLPALQAVHHQLVANLRQAAFDVEEEEGRAFRPHITLARRRASAQGGPPPGWPPAFRPDANLFALQSLTLFESRLSPSGPTHIALGQLPLAAPPRDYQSVQAGV